MLTALSMLGVAVGILVAGLGIGGVAVALAAQKTVENLFGSLSIGVDQPFRVGDFVTVDGLSGTVESIGLRSTRVRTLDRTLVTLPNGKLADMRIESYASRDRIKLGCTLLVAHGASPKVLRAVLAALRKLLNEHPKVFPDVSVALARVTDAAHEIEVLIWFKTTSGPEFLALREEVLLSMIDAIEGAGAKLAVRPPLVIGAGA
jgi:MscS family membrane protein